MTTYFLKPEEYKHFVTAHGRISLTEFFPHGITLELSNAGEVRVRQPLAGDDPEFMSRIERGLRRMNAAIMTEDRFMPQGR